MDLSAYSETVAAVLRETRTMPLVQSSAVSQSAVDLLRHADASSLFSNAPHAQAALAGIWLRAGDWNRAHDIAQDVPSSEGSYWHAIIHRMEPDAWNSGYWFRRAGRHPVFVPLQRAAADLAAASPNAGFRARGEWQPEAFTEFCSGPAAKRGSAAETLALAVQDAEWWLLFDWCAGVSRDIA